MNLLPVFNTMYIVAKLYIFTHLFFTCLDNFFKYGPAKLKYDNSRQFVRGQLVSDNSVTHVSTPYELS